MKKFFELLSMVALLIWGAVFIYLFLSGRVDNYLTSSFRPWVPISGLGLIALGIFNLVNINRATGACAHDHAHGDHSQCNHDHAHGDHCDHQHDNHHHEHDESCDHGKACDNDHHGSDLGHDDHDHHHHDEATASSLAFALLILLLPLLTAVGFSKDAFSGEYTKKWAQIEGDMQRMRMRKAAENRSAYEAGELAENPYADPGGDDSSSSDEDGWDKFTLEDLKKMVPQTSAGDFLLDVPQIFYTAGDEELMEVMEGISVETVAQVIEDTFENSPSNRLRAYRLLVECCAADARPLSIPIDFAEALPEYQEMGWYKLIGRLHFHKTEDFEYIPLLQIKSFEETPEPADWMGY